MLLDDQFNLMRTAIPGNRACRTWLVAPRAVHPGVTLPSPRGGAFDLEVRWQGGQPVPAAVPQLVYLNFEGASAVRVHGREPLVLPPFDAGSVAAHYAGASAEMAHEIAQTIRLDYARYNVLIFSSVDGPPPEDSEYSTIYFGGSDEALLDWRKRGHVQPRQGPSRHRLRESFRPIRSWTDTRKWRSIGNVASHMGHLLYHTDDPEEPDRTGYRFDAIRRLGAPEVPDRYATPRWRRSASILQPRQTAQCGGDTQR